MSRSIQLSWCLCFLGLLLLAVMSLFPASVFAQYAAIGACGLFAAAILCGVIYIILSVPGWRFRIREVVTVMIVCAISGLVLYGFRLHYSRADMQAFEEPVDNQLKLAYHELQFYAIANDGTLPAAERWIDALFENNEYLSKSDFQVTDSSEPKGNCRIAFNSNLGGKKLQDIESDVVLLFESDGGWNLNGTSELLDQTNDRYLRILLADGQTYTYISGEEYVDVRSADGKTYRKNIKW